MSILTNVLNVLPSLMQFATAKNNKLSDARVGDPSEKCDETNLLAQEYCVSNREYRTQYHENLNPRSDYYCESGILGYDTDMATKVGTSYATEEFRPNLRWSRHCYFERKGEQLSGVCREKNGLRGETYNRSQMPLNEFIQTARRVCSDTSQKFNTLQKMFLKVNNCPDSTGSKGIEEFARDGFWVRWKDSSSNLCYLQEGYTFEGLCRSSDGKISPKKLSREALLQVEKQVCGKSD